MCLTSTLFYDNKDDNEQNKIKIKKFPQHPKIYEKKNKTEKFFVQVAEK